MIHSETPTAVRIRKARTALLLDHPFFGTLLFRLKGRETQAIPTMATDGVSLFYNPSFVATLSTSELAGVLAQEGLHPGLQHHARRGGRKPARWNRACDYAINPLVIDAGLALPTGILLDHRFRGMSAERIYNLLEQQESDDKDEPSEGSGDGGSSDGLANVPVTDGGIAQVLDAPKPEDADGKDLNEQVRDWQIAVGQAENLARLAGKVPAGLRRSVEAARQAAVDWRELLRRRWSDTAPADYSWMRPNRRHLWSGLYLPGIIREGIGEMAIAVDCSESVAERLLGLFESEVRSILVGQRPQRVHVLYFDTVVHHVDTYQAGQEIDLKPMGGGGTDFCPCFEWIEEHGLRPQVLVFLTDLYGTFPESAPSYPVLWASTGSQDAPFGEVIPMAAA